ncbi:uncharacterized protein LOC115034921 [Acyrthosiphon pisum]|uniref:Uncharacterized protein n=1 Tax=Acyrthosiphon pisum TaxID=7029 RepID=A0A8R2NW38_ACYPI|nr:uncharacterized protein LOC115034921 [Acyrthosiphon pisum]
MAVAMIVVAVAAVATIVVVAAAVVATVGMVVAAVVVVGVAVAVAERTLQRSLQIAEGPAPAYRRQRSENCGWNDHVADSCHKTAVEGAATKAAKAAEKAEAAVAAALALAEGLKAKAAAAAACDISKGGMCIVH